MTNSNMRILAIDGAESTGKSTLKKAVQESEEMKGKIHVVDDLARRWYETNNMTPENMTKQDHENKQLDMLEDYIRERDHAFHAGKDLLIDSSPLTMYAYAVDVMKPYYVKLIENLLLAQSEDIKSIVLPPILPLKKDTIRFNDEGYRIKIHKRIMQAVGKYNIDYIELSSMSLPVRVDDTFHFIDATSQGSA